MTTPKLKMLTRADILEADDRKTEDIDVPAWGGTLRIRSMTGAERDSYEASGIVWGKNEQGSPVVDSVSTDNMRARLVALTAIGEDGARLFSERDIVALGAKNAEVLNAAFDVARRLSGITKEDVEALSAGLKGAPSAPSGSD